MSLTRRTFMQGVAAGLFSYESLKPNLLKSLSETDGPAGVLLGASRLQNDLDISGLLQRLGQPQLVIQLDPAAHPDDTIKPGQPISLSWAVYEPVFTLTAFPPRPSERFSSFQLTLFNSGNQIVGPTRQRRLSVSPGVLPHDFYRIDHRDRLVTAELSDTTGAVAAQATFYLLVVRDNVPTWEWTDLASRYQWNRDHYMPTGILHNNADFGTLTFSPILTQTDVGTLATPLPAVRFPLPALTLDHNGIANLPFPSIHQDWPWFDRATLYPSGPIVRDFNYSVDITGTDQFGNVYQAISETRDVIVAVGNDKSIEEGLAFAAQIAALLLAVIGLFYPAVLVAAGGFQAIAAAGVLGALDPPEPDFNYLKSVGQENTRPSDSSALVRLVSLLLQIANTPQRLSAIESRMMGANLRISATGIARQNTALQGLALQKQSYLDTIRSMNDAAQRAGKVLPAAIGEIKSRPEVNEKAIQIGRETLAQGIPDEVLKRMRSAGLSKDMEITFVNAIRNPEMMKQLPDIDTALTNVVRQALLLTLTLQNEMPKALQAQPKA